MAIVQECVDYIEATPNDALKEQLVVTLKDICEGKIYVEGEGAKFTMMLSKYVVYLQTCLCFSWFN